VVEEGADVEQVAPSLHPEQGGGVAQGAHAEPLRVEPGLPGVPLEQLVGRPPRERSLAGPPISRGDVGQVGGRVAQGGKDVIGGLDGGEPAGGPQVSQDRVPGLGWAFGPALAVAVVPVPPAPGVPGRPAIGGEIAPAQVADLGAAATGAQVEEEEGIVPLALDGVAGDGLEQGAGLVGGEGLGLVMGGRPGAGGMGGWVGVVEVGLDGVGVEGGDGGQVELDGGHGEPAPAQAGGPAGHVGGRDNPGGLTREAGKVVQGAAVGAAGVGGAGGLEPAVGGVGPVGLSVVQHWLALFGGVLGGADGVGLWGLEAGVFVYDEAECCAVRASTVFHGYVLDGGNVTRVESVSLGHLLFLGHSASFTYQ
jgi:hypothetical protein